MLYSIEYIQVRKKSLVVYDQKQFASYKQKEKIANLNNGENATYKGFMSPTAQKNLKKKIEIWRHAVEVHNSQFENRVNRDIKRMVFVTLTLSSSCYHSDRVVKREVLKPFLRIMREKYNCENYVWKAERQQNGNIHFHLIFDKYISKEALQQTWNNCQNNLGLIDEFEKKFKYRNPPSTHIEIVSNSEQCDSYIAKYITKNDVENLIDGTVWSASTKIMSLKYFECEVDIRIENALIDCIERDEVTRIVKTDYAMFILENISMYGVIKKMGLNAFYDYELNLMNFLYKNEVFDDFSNYLEYLKEKINVATIIDDIGEKKERIKQLNLNFYDEVPTIEKNNRNNIRRNM